MKIIVVDDEMNALTDFLANVVDIEIEYSMFKNEPLAAVEYVKKNNVSAAFLDINMPKINGVDLAELLIKQNDKIKIVFISGYAQDESDIKRRLDKNLVGFCYKPYNPDRLLGYIKEIYDAEEGANKNVFIRTFGAFDVFIKSVPIKFTSNKSKELLALLVNKNGSYLYLGEAIACLWPNKNVEQGKILYRDAVWRLRFALKDASLSDLVIFGRGQSVINKDFADCDYWDSLVSHDFSAYGGVYMPNYDWSIETQNMLDILQLKSNGKEI